MNTDRICLTAYGAVTPLGGSLDEISHALQQGISGIRTIEKFDTKSFQTKWAGVPELGNQAIRWPRAQRGGGRPGELLYAETAIESLVAQFNPAAHYPAHRIGCVLGIDDPSIDPQRCTEMAAQLGTDGCNNREQLIAKATDYFRVSEMMDLDVTAVLRAISRHVPFSGYARCHVGLCSASLQALGMARQAILDDKIDAAVVGGVSAKVTPFNLAQLEAIGALCTDPLLDGAERCRPFDSRRSGFIPAEGAVLFVMERESAVLARGGTILAFVSGYGASLAAEHVVAPHSQSREMYLCMQRALADAGVAPEHIDLINAHGTSTKLNDYHESQAFEQVFGVGKVPPVTATKSMHGHLIAAAGAMEVLGTIASFRDGFIPGVVNLEQQDEAIQVPVVAKTRPAVLTYVLKNSFGMGGLAASMVLQHPAAD